MTTTMDAPGAALPARPTADGSSASAEATTSLTIALDAGTQLNFAMVENAIPLVQRISLTNEGHEALCDLEVRAELPGFGDMWSKRVAEVPAGASYHLRDVDLPLSRDRFVNLVEGERVELLVTALRDGAVVQRARHVIDVLAYNEWSARSVPQLLSAFVMPNHPVVSEVLKHARGRLERATGSPAFDGYQSKSRERVRAMAAAIYETLQALDVTYVNPPASFEIGSGQKIRTPEQVLGHRMGTCLDLTVFLAACLEQAGLHPLLFVVNGHAFPGVWLDEFDLREGVSDDVTFFRKHGAALAFDSSLVASRPVVGFREAERSAGDQLNDDESFLFAVDVKGARRQRYRPLPARMPQAFVALEEEPPPLRPEEPAAARARADILVRTADLPETAVPEQVVAEPSGRYPRIEIWKQSLLDLTLRNKLINFRETKIAIPILCPNVARFEDALAAGETFAVAPQPSMLSESDPRVAEQVARRSGDDALEDYLSGVLEKGTLHADLTPGVTSERLKAVGREYKLALEETGSNTLCFALGFLAWYESESSEKRRLAPLLLVPAKIEKDGNTYLVSASDEDTRVNVTLLEKIRNDFGVVIPDLEELPADESGVDVPRVFELVREAVLDMPRWDVLEEVHLTHFTFAKFVMWRDLEEKAEALLESELVQHLVCGRGERFPAQDSFARAEALDTEHRPGDLVCPLDADSTQLTAIASAVQGTSFVLQGPPGTGKSQTITNLIATALARGKRVLFVSEKMAALEVVHQRLTRIGLGDFCLELHSNKANKRAVVEQLGRALEAEALAEPPAWPRHEEELTRERDHLNDYAAALHRERSHGLSVHRALSRLMRLRDVPRLPLEVGSWGEARREGVLEALRSLEEAAALVAPIADNPWRDTSPPELGVGGPQVIATTLGELEEATAALGAAAAETAALLPEAPSSLAGLEAWAEILALVSADQRAPRALLEEPDWDAIETTAGQLLALGQETDTQRSALLERYREDLFELDLPALVERVRRWSGAFFLVAWWMLRSARRTLRAVARQPKLPPPRQLTEDLEGAQALTRQTRQLAERAEVGRRYFGARWDAPERDWSRLRAELSWAGRYRAAANVLGAQSSPEQRRALLALAEAPPRPGGASSLGEALARWTAARDRLAELLGCAAEALSGGPEEPELLARLRPKLASWRAGLPHLRDWRQYRAHEDEVRGLGLELITGALRRGDLATGEAVDAFERAFLEQWLDRVIESDTALQGFHGSKHSRHVERFVELDRSSMPLLADVARARIAARVPAHSDQVADSSEVGVLRRELAKQRRHMPVRRLFERIPTLLERLKPCILMSPLSVAQYLDPKARPFDLVVFDEASQIPTHDAIGALARGQKAVVVGDSKQLPPTTFFQQTVDEDEVSAADDDHFDELESILDECVASQVPELLLGWHYRSQHESLITFSNHHYYDNRLNTFPSATETTDSLGVSLRLVDGYYDKGKSRTNRREAEELVAEVVRRLRDPVEQTRSIGVVTFSKAQQELIDDLLAEERRRHPEIEDFFEGDGLGEQVLVKNLENIQGDERDVMLFSVCYGPDQAGKVSMNFGPLNRDGGERRLNVAITRARQQLIVFSTLRPESIDLSRTRAKGVHDLKTFLDYAVRGPRAIAEALTIVGDADFDSPFEEEVCHRLAERGWRIQPQVGCAGYRIDLGVYHPEDPGRFVLGIECDGAAYHSAKSARDRDRLRAEVLGRLGWTLHRIWSTDWWHQPEREVERAEEAIRRAMAAAAEPDGAPAEMAGVASPRQATDVTPPMGTRLSPPSNAREPSVATPKAAAAPRPVPAGRSGPEHLVYTPVALPTDQRLADDCYEPAHAPELARVAWQVLEAEAPLSTRLLARRVAPYWSLGRATKRFEKRLLQVLQSGRGAREVAVRDGFVWLASQRPEDIGFRVPGDDDDSRRDAPDVPLEEVASAAHWVLETNLSLSPDDLVRETARLLGYGRVGKRVSERMEGGIRLLVEHGRALHDEGGLVRLG